MFSSTKAIEVQEHQVLHNEDVALAHRGYMA